MNRFAGKTVIVTGGSSGIGAACVQRLHSEGAFVMAVGTSQKSVDNVVSQFGGSDRIHGLQVDVTKRDQVAKLVHSADERFGSLYGLINCAGVRGVGTVLDFEPDNWHRVMSVNLDGTFNACQSFARALRAKGASGAIVNLSSGAGIVGIPNRLGYSASKFAVSGITKSMSLELAPFGIRVNAVAPGMVRTPMTSAVFEDAEKIRRIRAAHPIGREGSAEEVAAAIAFLLSEDASFITGVVLAVDGGNTVGIPSF